MKENIYTEINPCGIDNNGNLHRWVGFDKITDTFQGSDEIIARLNPPVSQDTQETI